MTRNLQFLFRETQMCIQGKIVNPCWVSSVERESGHSVIAEYDYIHRIRQDTSKAVLCKILETMRFLARPK